MNPEAKNFESIAKAKADHDEHCPAPAHTVLMNPHEIQRMGWEEGDRIAGMELVGDGSVGTGAFRLLCDRMTEDPLDVTVMEERKPVAA